MGQGHQGASFGWVDKGYEDRRWVDGGSGLTPSILFSIVLRYVHMRWTIVLLIFLSTLSSVAQLPRVGDMGNDGRKVAFRPFLGRVASYSEFLGFGVGQHFNVEGSPIMTDIFTLNIRVGAGLPYFGSTWANETSLIYSLSAEFGRRRSRLLIGGGLWNLYFSPTQNIFGEPIPARVDFNLFGSVGYRYQAPKGFMFGTNLYLIGGQSEYGPSINTRNNYPVFTIWPSVYMGYRIPSCEQHKSYVSYAKLSRPERKASRQTERAFMRSQIFEPVKPDSTHIWRNSEFGLSIFGPGLVTLHYTLYASLGKRQVVNYYLRTGLGTAMPLLQGHLDMGMAFLWNNTGFQVGGGLAASLFQASVDPYVTLRGKVNLAKGFSGFAGVNLIWSLGEPFTFISQRGKPYILPTVGVAYRLNRLKA